MNSLRVSLGLSLAVASCLLAQDPALTDAAGSPAPALAPRTAEELEQLVSPIALYPDALIALILPASTAPADIVLAARHLRDFPGDSSQIEHRAWDESVKSLTHYPQVLQWMDENLQWTKQLGEAFARQPADVMQAVQRLRARARARGTLIDTPQQQIIAEPQVIRIVPAQPDVIYVPYYQPEIVFVDRPAYYPRPFLTFGVGVPVGSWLAFDCDWRRHTIWIGNRHRRWTGHDWRQPVVPIGPVAPGGGVRPPEVRPWRPPSSTPRPPYSVAFTQPLEIAQPSPFGSPVTHAPASRPGSSFNDRRRPETNTLPSVAPLPRTFTVQPDTSLPGPRVASRTLATPVVPPLPTAHAPMPGTPIATVVAPPPAAERSPATDSSWMRRHETRVRPPTPAVASSAPLPAIPSMPIAAPPPSVATVLPAAPPAGRGYARSAPQQVASAPALPIAAPPHSGFVPPNATQSVPAAPPAPAPQPGPRNDSDRRPSRRNDGQAEH